jgi:glycosyltransferase involved in cell wall biosynthesis
MADSGTIPDGRFIVAFQGRRDYYQVPLALAEAGLLERFITDTYAAGWRGRFLGALSGSLRSKLARRHCDGIPEELVDSCWRIEVWQKILALRGKPRERIWRWGNRRLSLLALRAAEKHRGHLLLYEPYAWEAFVTATRHRHAKVLFHFHIHPELERRLIEADATSHPMPEAPWTRVDALPGDDDRVVDLWRHADLVLCASSFTRQSLVDAGMPLEKCAVVPYGIDVAEDADAGAPPGQFSALFVGGGVQRKGIHHLIKAWSEARLPIGSKLTLVCRNLDPALETMMTALPESITLRRGVSAWELKELFRTSSLFVMPSLVEGFGQVYLESLASGCPVLGTPHSGLPDLGTEEDGIFLVRPGDTGDLRERLETLAARLTLPDSASLRGRALATARRFPWSRFRSGIVEAVSRLQSST